MLRDELRKLEQLPSGDKVTPEYLTACIRDAIGEDAIVVCETVTNFQVVGNHCGATGRERCSRAAQGRSDGTAARRSA